MPARPPFTPSPRPEPGIAVALASANRNLGMLVGCTRRLAAAPSLLSRDVDWRRWRWLCLPAGYPFCRENA